jgi:periplasmic protein TonB
MYLRYTIVPRAEQNMAAAASTREVRARRVSASLRLNPPMLDSIMEITLLLHLSSKTCASSSYKYGKCFKPHKMEPESILTADWLDLIFENQNKEYGAYRLRKGYPASLAKSLAWVMLIPVALCMLHFIDPRFFSGARRTAVPPLVQDTMRIIEVALSKAIPIRTPSLAPRPRRPVPPPTILEVPVFSRLNPAPPRMAEQWHGDDPGPGAANDSRAGEGEGLNGSAPMQDKAPGGARSAGAAEGPLAASEVIPQYPGGLQALSRFLTKNLRAPKSQEDSPASVRVLVQFIVDKTGQISGVEILQSGGEDFDREVMRVVHKMPVWSPGMQNGQRVCVYFRLPVIFQVASEN